ncbi:unannotated protein [freshwater metagenome]|uniref:Unannotated protein n=1 Tax=freshwater metagenome TaxID=449393 RepID=A0A6J6ZQP1_9ZZZZ
MGAALFEFVDPPELADLAEGDADAAGEGTTTS